VVGGRGGVVGWVVIAVTSGVGEAVGLGGVPVVEGWGNEVIQGV